MVGRLGSIVLGALLITGCIFPSFDGMQGTERAKDADENEKTESSPTDVTVKNTELASDAGQDSSVVGNSQDAGTSADAATDVVTKSPGAGKIACPGAGGDCPVGEGFCCAGYTLANGPYCSSAPHNEGWCTGGNGRTVYCDEKQDCPGSQVCCETGSKTACSNTCTGKVLP